MIATFQSVKLMKTPFESFCNDFARCMPN